jgi:hypothetical protein
MDLPAEAEAEAGAAAVVAGEVAEVVTRQGSSLRRGRIAADIRLDRST